MRRILLDENLDEALKQLLSGEFDVRTVRERGWKGKKNGELLRTAEQEFDVFVTIDNNLEHQQNLARFKLGFIIMKARSNAYSHTAPLMPNVKNAAKELLPWENYSRGN
jgi:predicted nuclease of predicted toxin-antitoxin system